VSIRSFKRPRYTLLPPRHTSFSFQVSSKTRRIEEREEREDILRDERETGREGVDGREREMGRREETRAEKIKGGLKSGD